MPRASRVSPAQEERRDPPTSADATRQEEQMDQSPARARAGSGTVTVACKLPNGVILQLYRLVDGSEMTPMGPQSIKMSQKVGDPVIIRGSALPFGVAPDFPMQGRYALTEGVPEDFWDEWCRQNADSDLIKSRVIFAHARPENVVARAREQSRETVVDKSKQLGKVTGVQSGLEPIDPRNPPRVGMKEKMTVTPYEAT